MKKAALATALLMLFSSASFAAERNYSPAPTKIALSKKAKDAYAQGCRQGQVWCCKRTFSGGTSCECASFCN